MINKKYEHIVLTVYKLNRNFSFPYNFKSVILVSLFLNQDIQFFLFFTILVIPLVNHSKLNIDFDMTY